MKKYVYKHLIPIKIGTIHQHRRNGTIHNNMNNIRHYKKLYFDLI